MLIYYLPLVGITSRQLTKSCIIYFFLNPDWKMIIYLQLTVISAAVLCISSILTKTRWQIFSRFTCSGTSQLCIWRIVLPLPTNFCPTLSDMCLVLDCCCKYKSVHDFRLLITILHFRVAFIQVSPRISFSTSAPKILII